MLIDKTTLLGERQERLLERERIFKGALRYCLPFFEPFFSEGVISIPRNVCLLTKKKYTLRRAPGAPIRKGAHFLRVCYGTTFHSLSHSSVRA